MSSTSISIIMPAYNCERFLLATLDSLLSQTVTDWECIIVDDGSQDGTAAVAAAYASRDTRIRVIQQPNGGPSVARNRGFQECHPASKYVTFMDSDDIYLPDALSRLKTELANNPQAIGAHGLADYIDENGERVNPGEFADQGRQRYGFDGRRKVLLDTSQPTTFDVLVDNNVLYPPGLILTRKEFYDKVGPFDESFRGPEDWDMLIRLSRHGDFQFINQVILLYRRHSSNLSAMTGHGEKMWRVRCKAFFSSENSQDQQQRARGGWKAYQRDMMSLRLKTGREHLSHRRYLKAGDQIARIPVHIYRYLLGHPTPVIR